MLLKYKTNIPREYALSGVVPKPTGVRIRGFGKPPCIITRNSRISFPYKTPLDSFDSSLTVLILTCACVLRSIVAEKITREQTSNQEMATSHGNVHIIAAKEEWETKIFEATTSGKIVVVDFTAAWCGPCKMIAPFYAELSEKYPQLLFLKVDVDELADLAATWDVRAMPTFIFIKDGKQIDKLVGANKPELEKKIGNYATAAAAQ